jgi:hypothetical protein
MDKLSENRKREERKLERREEREKRREKNSYHHINQMNYSSDNEKYLLKYEMLKAF